MGSHKQGKQSGLQECVQTIQTFQLKTKKNFSPERLEISANEDENNESISVTNSEAIDFNFYDLLKQSSTNDTGMGNSATTDISWDIVHEEGDNSEC